MRKPARQHPPDQAEELPIGADPHRRLGNSKRDPLRALTSRGRPGRRGTGYSSAKTYAATTRASRSVISSSYLERTQGLEALRLSAAGPCQPAGFHINPLVGVDEPAPMLSVRRPVRRA